LQTMTYLNYCGCFMVRVKECVWLCYVTFFVFYSLSVYGYLFLDSQSFITGGVGEGLVHVLFRYFGYVHVLSLVAFLLLSVAAFKSKTRRQAKIGQYVRLIISLFFALYVLTSLQWSVRWLFGLDFPIGTISEWIGFYNLMYLGELGGLLWSLFLATLGVIGLNNSWGLSNVFVTSSSPAKRHPRNKNRSGGKNKVDVTKVTSIKNDLLLLPSINILKDSDEDYKELSESEKKSLIESIEQAFMDFKIDAKVVGVKQGPVITQLHVQPAPGVKTSSIINIADDIARSIKVESARVGGVITGTSNLGIEIPNPVRAMVRIKEVLGSSEFIGFKGDLPMALGCDLVGEPCVIDLTKTPHLLVAGTTGSGKSVGVNAMIISLLYKFGPEKLRFIMIDPKMLELSVYQGIPHMLSDVITDMSKAFEALSWCVNEMDERYRLMSQFGVRNINGYNETVSERKRNGIPILDQNGIERDFMPFIVVVIDEFADLIMTTGKKVEELVARLAQKSRACGMHMIIATQRPSVDVLTGLIKANIPSRISFQVSSKIDSRTILDQQGGEQLLGMGDMLISIGGKSSLRRAHAAFVEDSEVTAVVKQWKSISEPVYVELNSPDNDECGFKEVDDVDKDKYLAAIDMMENGQEYSISKIQRNLHIGYNKSSRIVESLINNGVLVPDEKGRKIARILVEGEA
jgi:DNA segregation ATPase FtsK/SpoIIIE-like protein